MAAAAHRQTDPFMMGEPQQRHEMALVTQRYVRNGNGDDVATEISADVAQVVCFGAMHALPE